MARYLYSELAMLVQAYKNCIASHNEVWQDRHEERILSLVKEYLPSGSGFDCGTKLDIEASHGEKLVFTTSFHHMNEGGYYDGWTEHRIVCTPSFSGVNLRISGRNRNEIKDYMHEVFYQALMSIPEPKEKTVV